MIKLPENIQKDLEAINAVSKDLQMKFYAVGGFPRDLVSGEGITEDTDLDVTEGNGNAFDLAFFVSAKYGLAQPVVYPSSGTALITMPSGRPVEFHNAFHDVPHIIDQLYKMGIEPTPLNKDIYSRDFTINTLLFDPENGEILDVTGLAIEDINNKVLRTPIDPNKTLARSPKNILRGIRFAVQFGLTIDEEYEHAVANHLPALKQWLRDNPNSEMASRTVKKTIEADANQAFSLYEKYGLLDYLPPTPEVNKYIKKQMFGIEISPEASSDEMSREAQTRMIDHLMKEREKHKAYMRRKKREQTEDAKKKYKIMERARSGYYLDNPEPEFLKKKKIDRNNKILNYVRDTREHESVASGKNWYKIAQEESDIGLEGGGYGAPGQQIRNMDERFVNDEENQIADPALVFVTEFANENGVTQEVSEQIFKYITAPEFMNDTIQVATDAKGIIDTISNPVMSLPVENQTAIGELEDVQRIFQRNSDLMRAMISFQDSNGKTYKELIGNTVRV